MTITGGGVRSIRIYLLSRLLAGTALAIGAAGAAVYVLVARSLEARLDENLDDRVQAFASIVFQVGEEIEVEFSDELMPEYARAERPQCFEIRREGGELLERSASLAGLRLERPAASRPQPLHWSAPMPDGRAGRFAAQLVEVHHVYPEEGPDRPVAAVLDVVVGRGREELAAAERRALGICAVFGLALLLLIAFLARAAVDRGLAPAKLLAGAVDAIQMERLPPRLDVGALPRELAPVSQKVDALLGRVRAALERERRTAADIAHELRTPISEVLTVAEVALLDREGSEGTRGALGTVRDVAWRMGRTVATLLKLARLEMGEEGFERVPVDLEALFVDVRRSLGPLEEQRDLRVACRFDAGEPVDANADVLRIVLANLLSNALSESPIGGAVECELARGAGAWLLSIENAAPGLRAEDLSVLAEPFWRKDRSRTDGNRAGLGLALSRALAEKALLALRFELAAGRFRAVLGPAEREGAELAASARDASRGAAPPA